MRSEVLILYPRFGTSSDATSQDRVSYEHLDARVFLDSRGVVVTGARFLLPQRQTYAIDGITAVRMHRHMPSQTGPILCIFAGVGMGAIGNLAIWIAAAIILAGIVWFALLKPRFSVVLSSTAGETEALEDQDRRWIEDIVSALDNAIAHRICFPSSSIV
ncbi:DUF6232 family protein [Paraburkholderia antibiotica]|nr:DUF6232 family protein [Paraburkholderia antibiotica]